MLDQGVVRSERRKVRRGYRRTRIVAAPTVAAAGRVTNQARMIPSMVRQRAAPESAPIPKRAPHETCVVETGIPQWEASNTIDAVAKLAASPCRGSSVVIPWLMVSATRRALNRPPKHNHDCDQNGRHAGADERRDDKQCSHLGRVVDAPCKAHGRRT